MQVNPIRDQILALVPEGVPENELADRIGAVASILQDHPEMSRDREVYQRLIQLTDGSQIDAVNWFRSNLIFNHAELGGTVVFVPSPSLVEESHMGNALAELSLQATRLFEETGELLITEEAMRGMGEKAFWDFIEREEVQTLSISLADGTSIVYDKGFVPGLLENRPPLSELTEEVTLRFVDGGHIDKKARLRLCGEFFNRQFDTKVGDAASKKIVFPRQQDGAYLSSSGLHAILRAISEQDELIDARDFLQFTPLQSKVPELPAGVHGQADWNQFWGDVGEVPAPPQALLDALEASCPFSDKKSGLKMRDTHFVTWVPPTINGKPLTVNLIEEIANSDKFGDKKIGYSCIYDKIRTDSTVNKPLDKGYWLARAKVQMGGTTYADQKSHLPGGYEFPTVREAIVTEFMHRVTSSKEEKPLLAETDPVRYTRCDEVVDYRCAVGALARAGLDVDFHYDDDTYAYVGVSPVRKFF